MQAWGSDKRKLILLVSLFVSSQSFLDSIFYFYLSLVVSVGNKSNLFDISFPFLLGFYFLFSFLLKAQS